VSDYLRRLPIGRRVSTAPLTGNDLWPFDVDLETVPLAEPIIPEPARAGPGGVDCPSCQRDATFDVWQDDHWVLGIPAEPSGLPIIAVLVSRAHHDLEDLPADLASELGPMIQRVARAIGSLADVGRVHVNRWGDGSEHFHVWFLARPKGMWGLRGALLAAWDDLLPNVPQDEWDRNRQAVAEALAAGGGYSLRGD
jgi:diadenosine tetraphosphate (Ap4A) HIT family hydrolase